MRFPRHCGKCPIACGEGEMLDHSAFYGHNVEYMRFLNRVKCPLISTRNERYLDGHKLNDIDWTGNGWPEPAPFDGPVDISGMPYEVFTEWYRECDRLDSCRNT